MAAVIAEKSDISITGLLDVWTCWLGVMTLETTMTLYGFEHINFCTGLLDVGLLDVDVPLRWDIPSTKKVFCSFFVVFVLLSFVLWVFVLFYFVFWFSGFLVFYSFSSVSV